MSNKTTFPDIGKTSFNDFAQHFYRMLAYYDTYEEAYEAVERHYEKQHGKRKYSSYNSFRTVRDRKMKDKQTA